MSASSVSFRISRHAEDLAETLHALSQRLVAMEHRLGSLELQLKRLGEESREEAADLEGLVEMDDNIARLLHDCRELLGNTSFTLQPSADAQGPQPSASAWPESGGAHQDGFCEAA